MNLLIGFLIALTVGLTGIGGGSFTVPALILLVGSAGYLVSDLVGGHLDAVRVPGVALPVLDAFGERFAPAGVSAVAANGALVGCRGVVWVGHGRLLEGDRPCVVLRGR